MDWAQSLPISPWTVAAALVVVALVHEWGHGLAAAWLHVPVRLITVGMGPTLWRHQLGSDTQLVLRAVPATMAVAVEWRWGKDGRLQRPVHHDMLIAAAGPVANLILSLLLFLLLWAMPTSADTFYRLLSTALISLITALISLLPLPGLDGGHLMLLGAAALGWHLTPTDELRLHRWGMRLIALVCGLLLLALLITFF